MSNGRTFSESVSAWVRKSEARQAAVIRESVQRVLEVAQTPGPSVANPGGGRGGAMPIDSGFLRASLVIQIGNGSALAPREKPPGNATYDPVVDLAAAALREAAPGDKIVAAWTANYSIFAENKYAFARLAAQQFPQIVAKVCREAEARGARP